MSERAPIIEWDDSYPTDQSLARAKNYWRGTGAVEWHEVEAWLRKTLEDCADNCVASYREEQALDVLDRPVTHIHFSTGGWSGAEEVIDLIEGNWVLSHRMLQWRRGGHYIFEIDTMGAKT